MGVMEGQVDAVQLERELVGIGVFVEVTGFDRDRGCAYREVEPAAL